MNFGGSGVDFEHSGHRDVTIAVVLAQDATNLVCNTAVLRLSVTPFADVDLKDVAPVSVGQKQVRH